MITVDGIDYEVELVNPALGSQFIGTSFLDQQRIEISNALGEQRKRQVFWHEISHVWIQNEEELQMLGAEHLEGLVTRLGASVFAALQNNGLLVDGWWDQVIDRRPVEDGLPSKPLNVVEKNADSSYPLRIMDGAEKDTVSGPLRDERAGRESGRVAPAADVGESR